MNKKLYWLVESNGDLSVTVQDITTAEELIMGDYENETEGGLFDIDDLQYTITPKMLTDRQYENLSKR
jgi:hypothetical protein